MGVASRRKQFKRALRALPDGPFELAGVQCVYVQDRSQYLTAGVVPLDFEGMANHLALHAPSKRP